MPPPIAVERASSCSFSIGAQSSATVPITPEISPLSLAAIIAAAPPAIPLAPDEFSISALKRSRFLSDSLNLPSIV